MNKISDANLQYQNHIDELKNKLTKLHLECDTPEPTIASVENTKNLEGPLMLHPTETRCEAL